MTRRLLSTLLSSLCLITATSMLIAFIKSYTVPHTLTNMFTPQTCRIIAVTGGGDNCGGTSSDDTLDERRGTEISPDQSGSTTIGQHGKEDGIHHSHRGSYSIDELGIQNNNRDKLKQKNATGSGILYGQPNHRETTLRSSNDNVTVVSDIKSLKRGQGLLRNVSYTKDNLARSQANIDPTNRASEIKDKSDLEHQSYLNTTTNTDIPLTLRPDKTCCFENSGSRCDQVYVDILESIEAECVPLIEDPWIYYSMASEQQTNVCPCPSCRVSHHEDGSYSVSVGDHSYNLAEDIAFPCYVNSYEPDTQVLWYKMSTLMVLNLMFWPTLFFMVGFVGLFFSCLYLQYEDCSDNWCSRTLRI